MTSFTDAIKAAIAVFIVLGVAALIFYFYNQSVQSSKIAGNKITALNNQMADSQYTLYDGTIVNGSEVFNCVKKFVSEPLGIKVITARGNGTWYGAGVSDANDTNVPPGPVNITSTVVNKNYSNATNITNTAYINPSGQFMGTVVRDDNGVVTGIVFNQQ